MNNRRFNQFALIPWFGERDLTDQVLSLHVMPMYHGMGVIQSCWAVSPELTSLPTIVEILNIM